MPFVQDFKKRVEKFGPIAFNRTLLFNERETLVNAREFFKRALGYEKIDVISTEEAENEEERRAVESAVPGEPGIVFRNI
jgi:leucyl-tRNA synthetase